MSIVNFPLSCLLHFDIYNRQWSIQVEAINFLLNSKAYILFVIYLIKVSLIYMMKKSLNSDCQQFHQYLQNQKTTSHLNPFYNTKKTMTFVNGNPRPHLGKAQKRDRLNLINMIPTPPFLITGYMKVLNGPHCICMSSLYRCIWFMRNKDDDDVTTDKKSM